MSAELLKEEGGKSEAELGASPRALEARRHRAQFTHQSLVITDLSEEGARSEKPKGTEKVEGLIAIALYHT